MLRQLRCNRRIDRRGGRFAAHRGRASSGCPHCRRIRAATRLEKAPAAGRTSFLERLRSGTARDPRKPSARLWSEVRPAAAVRGAAHGRRRAGEPAHRHGPALRVHIPDSERVERSVVVVELYPWKRRVRPLAPRTDLVSPDGSVVNRARADPSCRSLRELARRAAYDRRLCGGGGGGAPAGRGRRAPPPFPGPSGRGRPAWPSRAVRVARATRGLARDTVVGDVLRRIDFGPSCVPARGCAQPAVEGTGSERTFDLPDPKANWPQVFDRLVRP